MSKMNTVLRGVGYDFTDTQLLKEALTHRSAGGRHNERLEFLGDAVLSFVISSALYRARPDAREGELSRLRATLVRKETLADVAREINLGEYLALGIGELKSGGHRRDSILADGLEALLGAVFLDGGTEACRKLILSLFRRRMLELPGASELKDSKTRLQETLQSRQTELPRYHVLEATGEAHARKFRVECLIPGLDARSEGSGTSRRRAEQQAASRMLEQLDDN